MDKTLALVLAANDNGATQAGFLLLLLLCLIAAFLFLWQTYLKN